jgi:uncharacterized protein (TIGR03083 family)
MFTLASNGFLHLISQIGDDDWSKPGLGEWNIRELVGHASRAYLTVTTYLAKPAQHVDVHSAAEYLSLALLGNNRAANNAAVADRGRETTASLGDNIVQAINGIAEETLAAIDAAAANATVTTIAGGMLLTDFLNTRTFELVIHSRDIARALDLPIPADHEQPLQRCAEIVFQVAQRQGLTGNMLDALLGRTSLDFT